MKEAVRDYNKLQKKMTSMAHQYENSDLEVKASRYQSYVVHLPVYHYHHQKCHSVLVESTLFTSPFDAFLCFANFVLFPRRLFGLHGFDLS